MVPATEKLLSPLLRVPWSVHRNLLRLIGPELLADLNLLGGRVSLNP